MSSPVLSQDTPFDRALEEFKTKLPLEEQKAFETTTLKDLQTTIMTIQERQISTRTARNLRRLEGFLEAMESNAKIIEIFLNVHPFVAFIWGPMKLLLQMASTSANAFNAVIDAYRRIGEHMPLFKQYQDVFESNPHMRHVLQLNFQDILEFHSEALKFFKRKFWRQTFDALWKQFDSKFVYIVNNMQQHKDLLERQASLAEFEQNKQERLLMQRRFDKLEQEELQSRKTYLGTWLSTPDVHCDQERGQEAREDYPESGRWLLAKNRFRAWFDLSSPSDPLLWIHGMPGSGKTVLASLIVDEADNIGDANTLYFYFGSGDQQKQTFVGMARSLLAQILPIEPSKVSILYERVISGSDASLRTRKLAESLLDLCLRDLRRSYIILDGLDECTENEQKAIVSWMRKFVDNPNSTLEPNRCLFLSQYDSSTKALLSLVPAIGIVPADNAADISTYCHSWKSKFQVKFNHMEDSEFDGIAQTTASSAQGMFLFAKLVMSNLFGQSSLLRVRREMEDEIYPQELDEAYGRIKSRILSDSRPIKEDAQQLIAWLVCAIRPLKWREIQGVVAIDIENDCVDIRNGSWSVDHTELCGPFVELQPNGALALIHSTAKSYFIRNTIIVPQIEHIKLASRSLEYLRLPAFQPNLPKDLIRKFILDGTYSFLDYAYINWPRHLIAAFSDSTQYGESENFSAITSDLVETLDVFFDCQWRPPKRKPKVPTAVVESMRQIHISEEYRSADLREKLMLTLASMHRLTSIDIQNNSAIATLLLHDVVPDIRDEIENMALVQLCESTIEGYFGPFTAKCPKLYCDWYHEGFESMTERDQHVSKHDRPYLCPQPGCSFAKMGHRTAKELESHLTAYHNPEPGDDDFPPVDGEHANGDFRYPRQLQPQPELQHQSQTHPQLEDLTSNADPVSDHSHERERLTKAQRISTKETASQRRLRNPKTSFQCHICPRRFTRAYNLKSHVRTHTNERPHTCSVCGKAFIRAHDLKTHEDLHSGERRFVCAGILPSGSTWGCGKRFARASALERHLRNSEIGRACLKQRQHEEEAEKRKQMEEAQPLEARSPIAVAGTPPFVGMIQDNAEQHGQPDEGGDNANAGQKTPEATNHGMQFVYDHDTDWPDTE